MNVIVILRHSNAIFMADFIAIMLGWVVGLVMVMMKVVGDLKGILMYHMRLNHQQWGTEEVLENTHTNSRVYKHIIFPSIAIY